MPFAKGQSGNPGGKPKEKLFHQALMMQLKEAGEDLPMLREVATQLIDKAKEGDLPAIKELADRLDGKPAQQLNLAGHDGGAFNVTVSKDEDAL